MVELGHGVAAYGGGNFLAELSPRVELQAPGRRWHWGKVLFEKYWLSTGAAREFYRTLIQIGSGATGVEMRL